MHKLVVEYRHFEEKKVYYRRDRKSLIKLLAEIEATDLDFRQANIFECKKKNTTELFPNNRWRMALFG